MNGGKCSRKDGMWRCKKGWIGEKCKEIWNEGYYGEKCMMNCEWKNEKLLWKEKDGCVCRKGYKGENCEKLK
jgi:hypothetical protein